MNTTEQANAKYAKTENGFAVLECGCRWSLYEMIRCNTHEAAPELLEALRDGIIAMKALGWDNAPYGYGKKFAKAEAAILKAEQGR